MNMEQFSDSLDEKKNNSELSRSNPLNSKKKNWQAMASQSIIAELEARVVAAERLAQRVRHQSLSRL